MKNTKIAINGFGRIGRLALRLISDMDNMEVVAINDPFIDVDYAAYMLKYDTIHGKFNGEITTCGNKLVVNGKEIDFYNEKEIENLNWAKTGVDIVLEASVLLIGGFERNAYFRTAYTERHKLLDKTFKHSVLVIYR